ncbi:MAG: hypothetical protein A2622_13945 [Bdellovibrionales bacterium RIFCSPHIGHO2_01_FULL_40_29]|nr:MAG: hypothetical protein A2622_13945 [Bdellovibrionales bacterium RIFCSPHIGHO2_01_FULL_40_29]OFZ33623.1 MAG: hypothetical protein A3D17_11555 [Bdellovibrionales bacterium RIFCSPHIGHO2_02_FULL_40_15]
MWGLIAVKNNQFALCFLILLFTPILVFAADEKSAASSAKMKDGKKKIYLEFGNELVDAKFNQPSMDYIFIRKQANFKKMMKLRENFIPEVHKGKRDFSGSK